MTQIKLIGIYIGICAVFVLLIIVGWQSKRIRSLLVKLFQLQHDIELQGLESKKTNLKAKIKTIDEARRAKKNDLNVALKQLGD